MLIDQLRSVEIQISLRVFEFYRYGSAVEHSVPIFE